MGHQWGLVKIWRPTSFHKTMHSVNFVAKSSYNSEISFLMSSSISLVGKYLKRSRSPLHENNGAPFDWFVVLNIQSYTLSIFALGCRPDQSRTSQNSKICQTYRICKGKCPKFTYIWYISHLPFPLRAYSKLSSLVLDGTLFDFVSLGAFPLPLYNFSFLIHLFTGVQLMNFGFPRRFPFVK